MSPEYTIRPPLGFTFDCGTHTYAFAADGTFHDQGLAAVFGGDSGTLGSHAPKGWHDLQVAVNHRLPTAIHHSQKLRRATAHRLARGRRIR